MKRCAFVVLTLATACGGPNLHFDPAPAPPWVTQPASDVSARELRAVGAAPATVNSQRDADLATRDAKARIAQLFESQVVARSTDWSVAVASSEGSSQRNVTQQSVEVRSRVTVEDARVESSYRDEATKSAYVLVVVDRPAWSRRLDGRIADGLAELERAATQARTALDSGAQPLAAYAQVLAGYEAGGKVEADVVILDLLDSARGVRQKLLDLKARLAEVSRDLRERHPFVVDVGCTDAVVAQRLAGNLESFLKERGFKVDKAAKKPVRLSVTISERKLGTEAVAGRKEQVHAALGRLQVTEPNGAEVSELAVVLEGDTYQERDTDDARAAGKALTLAADTLASKFRSAYRTAYREAEGAP